MNEVLADILILLGIFAIVSALGFSSMPDASIELCLALLGAGVFSGAVGTTMYEHEREKNDDL